MTLKLIEELETQTAKMKEITLEDSKLVRNDLKLLKIKLANAEGSW
jgi:hypothetical protein